MSYRYEECIGDCRTCGHWHSVHSMCLTYRHNGMSCGCKDFVPLDNLKYLEYCLENKK